MDDQTQIEWEGSSKPVTKAPGTNIGGSARRGDTAPRGAGLGSETAKRGRPCMSWTHAPPPLPQGTSFVKLGEQGVRAPLGCRATAARQSPTLEVRAPGVPLSVGVSPLLLQAALFPSVPIREGLEVDQELQASGSQDPWGLPLSLSGPLFPNLSSGVTQALSLGVTLSAEPGSLGSFSWLCGGPQIYAGPPTPALPR